MDRDKMLRLIPLLVMLVLSAALAMGLFSKGKNDAIYVVNNGKTLPYFEIPSLGNDTNFSPQLFGKGRAVVVNVFASWCVPCAAEHELLVELAKKVNIYGIAWKDKPESVINYVNERGNPFQQIGLDATGEATLPLALTGVPETFVLDRNGAIALHYKAPLNEDIITKLIIPMVTQLNTQNVTAR